MNVILDLIYMGPVDLPIAHRKQQKQNEKFFTTVGLEPTTLRFLICCSTDCATRALMKAVLFKKRLGW